MKEVRVLDHGYVRLVDHMGSDLSIVRAARVSYDADWRAGSDDGSDAKLIRYLMHNHHTSPFEAVVFTFEVKAPIFVFRQWHRHRTWSYNELSARYAPLPNEFYLPGLDTIGKQSKSSKQARELGGEDENAARNYFVEQDMRVAQRDAYEKYEALLDWGVPRELARSVLPVSIYSRMFATVDLHNLMHFIKLRVHKHAQYEIRVYAQALLDLIEPIVPCAYAAFKEFQL